MIQTHKEHLKPSELGIIVSFSLLMLCGLTADKAGFVEAPAVALDLLGMVNRLLTGRTLGSSSPVWHLQLWHRL